MRKILAGVAVLACAGLAMPAQAAERRMFIIANDGTYGIDRCLAGGETCGAAAAAAYCRTHQFTSAASYIKVDREEITGAIPTDSGGGCKGPSCDNLVAIVGTR